MDSLNLIAIFRKLRQTKQSVNGYSMFNLHGLRTPRNRYTGLYKWLIMF